MKHIISFILMITLPIAIQSSHDQPQRQGEIYFFLKNNSTQKKCFYVGIKIDDSDNRNNVNTLKITLKPGESTHLSDNPLLNENGITEYDFCLNFAQFTAIINARNPSFFLGAIYKKNGSFDCMHDDSRLQLNGKFNRSYLASLEKQRRVGLPSAKSWLNKRPDPFNPTSGKPHLKSIAPYL